MRSSRARSAAALSLTTLVVLACSDRDPVTAMGSTVPAGSAHVSLTQATSTPYPNAPAGLTSVTTHTFSSCVGDGWHNCARVQADPDFSIVADAAAPMSAPSVARITFPAGFQGGDAPVPIMERRLPAGQRRLYGAMWLRLSPSWIGHESGINKLGFVWIHDQPVAHLSAHGAGNGALRLQVNLQGLGVGALTRQLTANVGDGTITRGSWHRIEYLLDANTPGQADGRVRFWLDGAAVGDHMGIGFSSASQRAEWQLVNVYPVWGGGRGVVPVTQWLDLDHYHVASSESVSAPPPPAPAPVASVVVTPASATLAVGTTASLSAVTEDSAGRVLSGRGIAWSSSAPAIASVSGGGVVSALGAGSATITATSEGRSASASITVAPPAPAPVARVTVTPTSSTLQVGGSMALSAALFDANGASLFGRPITWTSEAAAVATVSATGVVTALSAGVTTIRVTSEGQGASASIVVNAPPPPAGQGNEPTGFARLANTDFSSCTSDGWTNCARVTSDADYSIVEDAAAPRSSGLVARYRYAGGHLGGESSVAPAERAIPGGRQKLYGSLWFKLSANWQGHDSGVNKLGFVWMRGIPIVYFSAQGSGAGPLEMQVRLQGATVGPVTRNLGGNLGRSSAVSRGEWHRFEYVLEANTPGVADGRVRFWLDGIELASYGDVGFSSIGQSTDWQMVSVFPIWGGMGGMVGQEMSVSFDHYILSAAP